MNFPWTKGREKVKLVMEWGNAGSVLRFMVGKGKVPAVWSIWRLSFFIFSFLLISFSTRIYWKMILFRNIYKDCILYHKTLQNELYNSFKFPEVFFLDVFFFIFLLQQGSAERWYCSGIYIKIIYSDFNKQKVVIPKKFEHSIVNHNQQY